MATSLRLNDGRREWLASVDGSTVSIDGVEGSFVVTPRPDGRWSIAHQAPDGHDGVVSTGISAHVPEGNWTGVGSSTTQWLATRGSTRTRTAVVDHNLRAPMSATVIRVHVAVGSTVNEGDSLVVIEAMKMEMPLRAPRAGTVAAVHCREGELVPAGAVLVELE